MKDDIHLEHHFEDYISRKIQELSADGSWRVSMDDTGFDAKTALYIADFIEYMKATAPDKMDKMQKSLGSNWLGELERNLVKSLETKGTVLTLREGFPMAGYATIQCSGHYPDDPRLPKQKALYDANILRVMHQVHYQTAGNKSLDLVFFINGIPVATAEVKTELTQTVQDAIKEYQDERKPIEPGTKRKNFLLMYKRGAVVHFAISEDEIWMCTKLEGDKPKFLPFNKGNHGHAGNPPREETPDEYPTYYFWDNICQKDNWLKIFHNFIFEEVSKKEDVTGRMREQVTQLFPRYHQWDCVTKCVEDVKKYGAGQKYLIEHSAGSGKTETITWIAHELIRLMDDNGNKLFSSVIVVTDRLGLDTNIKKTIGQLKKTVGLIEMIGGDGDTRTNGAKSKALAQALKDKREIIVVTLQTFQFAMEAIANEDSLAGAKFAVLIDEAHSSQEGQYSGKMKAALKLAADKKKKEDGDSDGVTDEDIINAYFSQEQASRVMPENVSFFAFTATPKAETKTLFGRPGNAVDEKTGKPIPESFHLYPMRQAIEEGYILDVLLGYIPYQTAYKLKEDVVKDKVVDVRTALRTIALWENLHPTNVLQKTQFIIEHFVKNVSTMLDGKAKAMVVTSSRAAVVRYKYAIDAYLKAHPEYDREKIEEHLQFKVPGEPLVAFSGKISGAKCVSKEDNDPEVLAEFDYLKESPFAQIKTDYDYTEDNMNNLGAMTIENAYDTNKYRILIVANKYQTGFNQPKLCAMYIDKKISNDIEIVQTYSRLNRTYAGKDRVFIVDFVNDPKIVANAFKKYDTGAKMEKAQRLEVVYDIKKQLDDSNVYSDAEFQSYKKARYHAIVTMEDDKKETYRKDIYKSVSGPADRWKEELKKHQNSYATWTSYKEKAEANGKKDDAKFAEGKLEEIQDQIDNLTDFRAKLKKYVSTYDYISQIIDLGDPDLEVFRGFAKLLSHRISDTSLDEIDVRNLVLSDFRLNPLDVVDPDGDSVLLPRSAGSKSKKNKKESLRAIIAKLNEIWGPDVPAEKGARTVNAIADIVDADDIARTQIRNSTNSKEAVIADGRLETIIRMAAVSLKNNEFSELADKIISDPQAWEAVAELVFDLIDNRKRLDIPDIKSEVLNNNKKAS